MEKNLNGQNRSKKGPSQKKFLTVFRYIDQTFFEEKKISHFTILLKRNNRIAIAL